MEERWSRAKCKGGHQNPSFSSTLLDAIYRSIDETDGRGATGGAARDRYAPTTAPKRTHPPLRPTAERRSAAGRCRALAPISTSSSSDKSSYGGFSSSSEPDSVVARLKPIRTTGAPLSSAPPPLPAAAFDRREEEEKKKKKKTGSIRGKLRDMRGPKSAAPASPGARLAGFLGSLLSAVSGTPRRPPPRSPAAAAVNGCDDSACSTASSHSRSCLTKKPSTRERAAPSAEGGKRTVRFYPVSVIVDEDLRPCGQKSVYEADPVSSRRPSAAAMEARRRVEELLRGMAEEDEEEEMSDSSSDLFELENLTAIGRGGGRMDELPVYETTRLESNISFSQSQRFLKI
ncbi:protein BIG GRAIN 1-like [Canna indica]|uniref:Protein BIG GRAIN 1-like n=1 Tax=Canna indica TaxID=4628 RepID=A0AAQ3KA31_9LILI|nr:protein BIG GRAIN 1-like [Canna indica]